VRSQAEVDAGDLVAHWWMILHIHIQGGDNEAGNGRRSTTINGLGWHAQIGASLA